jgi:hypothetical protein
VQSEPGRGSSFQLAFEIGPWNGLRAMDHGMSPTPLVRGASELVQRVSGRVLVADDSKDNRDACLASGFDGYESKPIDSLRFDRMLAAFLSGKSPSASAVTP